MKITLEIDKEKRQAKILCADNSLTGDELFIAVATFLTVIADNIYSKHGTFEDFKTYTTAMINAQIEVLKKQLFNKENYNAN